jgi:hypothetical protein
VRSAKIEELCQQDVAGSGGDFLLLFLASSVSSSRFPIRRVSFLFPLRTCFFNPLVPRSFPYFCLTGTYDTENPNDWASTVILSIFAQDCSTVTQ